MLLRKLSDGLRSGHVHSDISELTLSWLRPFQGPSWFDCFFLSAGEVASSLTGVGHSLEELVTYPWSPVSLTVRPGETLVLVLLKTEHLVPFQFPGCQRVQVRGCCGAAAQWSLPCFFAVQQAA